MSMADRSWHHWRCDLLRMLCDERRDLNFEKIEVCGILKGERLRKHCSCLWLNDGYEV